MQCGSEYNNFEYIDDYDFGTIPASHSTSQGKGICIKHELPTLSLHSHFTINLFHRLIFSSLISIVSYEWMKCLTMTPNMVELACSFVDTALQASNMSNGDWQDKPIYHTCF